MRTVVLGAMGRRAPSVVGACVGSWLLLACSSSHDSGRDVDAGSGSAVPGTSSTKSGSAKPASSTPKSGAVSNGAAGVAAGTGGSGSGGNGGGSGGSAAALDSGVRDAGVDAGADAGSSAMPTVFRMKALYLRDPHFYLGTTDITDQPFLGQSVNGTLIQNGLTMDYDGDGYLDVSFLLVFRPLDVAAQKGSMQLSDGNCPLKNPTACVPKAQPGLDVAFTIASQAQGTCLDVVAGTTSAFTPAVTAPAGPCFVTTNPSDMVINLGGISIALTHAQIAATYQGDPPTQLISGLIEGFVTKQKAMQALLPSYLGPPLAGTALSSYLRAQDADMAKSPTGEDGWFLYVNFVAEPVTYTPPAAAH